jgi:RsiW-degrading membrane proteinase PrsW (M82 family)
MLEALVDIKKIVPAETFLLIVGIYMLEVIVLLSIFLTRLEHGGDPLDGYKMLTNGLLIGMAIFSFSVLLIYFIFSGILGMVWPT